MGAFYTARKPEGDGPNRDVKSRKSVHTGIRYEQWQERAGKVRVIQNVEDLRPKLHIQPLRNRRGLIDRKVPLPEVGPDERVAPFVAEVARASDAIRCTAGGGSNCTRNRK